MICNNPK